MSELGPEIVVQQVAWNEDHAVVEGEHSSALFNAKIFIDGVEQENALGIEVEAPVADFTVVKIRYSPGSLRFETVPPEEFMSFRPRPR